MKNIISKNALAILSFFFIFLFSCKKSGKGPIVIEKRDTEQFSEVLSAIPSVVYFVNDTVYIVEIEGQQNLIDLIETSVDKDKLSIRLKGISSFKSKESVKVTVHSPELEKIELTGSGNFYCDKIYSGLNMFIGNSGSGAVVIGRMINGYTEAHVSGSGQISIQSGESLSQFLSINGNGTIDVRNFPSSKTETETIGSGTIYLNAQFELMATILGSGNVYSFFEPILLTTNYSGSGRVIQK